MLAVFYLLKDTYSLSPAEVSFWIAMTFAPWLFKPFWAYLSDTVPINGLRRKPYLIIFSLIQFASYVAIGFSGSFPFWATITLLVTSGIGRCGIVSVAQALLSLLTRGQLKSLSGLDDVAVHMGRDNFARMKELVDEIYDVRRARPAPRVPPWTPRAFFAFPPSPPGCTSRAVTAFIAVRVVESSVPSCDTENDGPGTGESRMV